MTIFFSKSIRFFVLSSCLLCPIVMVIQWYIMYIDRMHRKLLNYVLKSNQYFNETKRARFPTFAISIVDSFCLLQQYKWSKIKMRLPRLIINVPIRDHSWLFHQSPTSSPGAPQPFFKGKALGTRLISRWKKTVFCREVILAVVLVC